MNISKIIGSHPFEGGIITISDSTYQLAIVPHTGTNPSAPKYQLVFKQPEHPFHDTRLSGLFPVVENTYRGDILLNGKKQTFKITLDKSSNLAVITR